MIWFKSPFFIRVRYLSFTVLFKLESLIINRVISLLVKGPEIKFTSTYCCELFRGWPFSFRRNIYLFFYYIVTIVFLLSFPIVYSLSLKYSVQQQHRFLIMFTASSLFYHAIGVLCFRCF